MMIDDTAEFTRQCGEAGEKITAVLAAYPKEIAVCVLPGVLASVIKVFGLSRESAIAMLDSALADIGDG